MPQIVNFDNRQVVEPGAYSQIRGLVPAAAAIATYGNVVLIDTGSGAGFGGGSGISGELFSGKDSIYEIASIADAKRFIRGGILYDIQDYLWSPSPFGGAPNRLFYVRAATTTAAKTAAIDFGENMGSVTVAARNEGACGNGTLSGGVITVGYGWGIRAGVVDNTAYIMDFYEGQYRGLDPNGIPIDGIAASEVTNKIVVSSPEFKTANELIAWMNVDYQFNLYFKLSASTASSTDIDDDVLTTYDELQTFTGGTTAYSASAMDAALENLIEYDTSLFLCDDYGITTSPDGTAIANGTNKGAQSAFNLKILAHIRNDAVYKNKIMFVGGGQDASQYSRSGTSDGSLETAAFYNDPNVVLVHSAIKMPSNSSTNGLTYKFMPSLYHAAMWCGLHAGMEPQVPGTQKPLRILGVKHELKKSERERALLGGVGHTRKVNGVFVINQSINTMQRNSSQVYNDGTSPEISIMRIIHQLNKEIVINLVRFSGLDLATANSEEIKSAIETYLISRAAEPPRKTGLILAPLEGYKVKVELINGDWFNEYCAIPNGPINRLFTTGFILDPKLAAV